LWARRGYCEELAEPVESEIAIGGDAHLGVFSRCPAALARAHASFVSDAFEAYAEAKRFGFRPEIEPQYLIEIDNQILAIEEAERRYRDKVAAAQRAAQKARKR
jgi:hypothetical protein